MWWKFGGEGAPGGMPHYMELGARVGDGWSPGGAAKVALRDPSKPTEDPMTDERMALVELLQKSGDGDFLRAVASQRPRRCRLKAGARSSGLGLGPSEAEPFWSTFLKGLIKRGL